MTKSTISLMNIDSERSSTPSKKRARGSSYRELDEKLSTVDPKRTNARNNGDILGRPYDSAAGLTPISPPELIDTRYELAPGFSPIPIGRAVRHEISDDYHDLNSRHNIPERKRGPNHEHTFSYFPPLSESTQAQPNGSRAPSFASKNETSSAGTWGTTALSAVGAAVGKVWEFCKTGAFRGFTAGGGSKYEVTGDPTLITERDFWEDANFEDKERRGDHESTPIPGQFPTFPEEKHDFIGNNAVLDSDAYESRPAKRRQKGRSDSDGHSWVLVSNHTSSTKTAVENSTSSTTRFSEVTPNRLARPPLRSQLPTSSASRRSIPTSASRAGNRRSAATPRISGVSGVSYAGSPALRSVRTASYASPRSPGGSRLPVPSKSGPATPEAQMSPAARDAARWAAQQRRTEREEDENLRRLNAQLQAMIRQGKEALSSTVEVEIDGGPSMGGDVDEGFEDGDFHAVGKRW